MGVLWMFSLGNSKLNVVIEQMCAHASLSFEFFAYSKNSTRLYCRGGPMCPPVLMTYSFLWYPMKFSNPLYPLRQFKKIQHRKSFKCTD